MERVAVAAEVGIEMKWVQGMSEKAVEDRIEEVGSLVSPDRVAVGMIALGDRKSRASSVDGGSRAHQAEGRCESQWLEGYLEVL